MNCKPGCLAYVSKLLPVTDTGDRTAKGLTDVRGTVVRCLRLTQDSRWEIESPFMVAWTLSGRSGFYAGSAMITAIGDQYLMPLDNPGDDAVDETLLLLPAPGANKTLADILGKVPSLPSPRQEVTA